MVDDSFTGVRDEAGSRGWEGCGERRGAAPRQTRPAPGDHRATGGMPLGKRI